MSPFSFLKINLEREKLYVCGLIRKKYNIEHNIFFWWFCKNFHQMDEKFDFLEDSCLLKQDSQLAAIKF